MSMLLIVSGQNEQHLTQGLEAGFCVHDNELRGYIKDGTCRMYYVLCSN